MTLIFILRQQRQVDSVSLRPAWPVSKFQASQVSIVRSYLKITLATRHPAFF